MQLRRFAIRSTPKNELTSIIMSKLIMSTGIQNPSFLHGETVREKYVTIDSLALRRTSLPLQLVPTDFDTIDDDDVPTNVVEAAAATPTNAPLDEQQATLKIQSDIESSQEEEEEAPAETTAESDASIANKADIDTDEVHKSTQVQVVNLPCHQRLRRRPSNTAGKFVAKPKWASTVFHYLPRHSRKKSKLAKSAAERQCVSHPTDFVHVAGITRWSWLSGSDLAKVITHEEKCATLTLIGDNQAMRSKTSSVETLVNDCVEEPVEQATVPAVTPPQQVIAPNYESAAVSPAPLQANRSFLWSTMSKYANGAKIHHPPHNYGSTDDYDDVGPALVDEPDDAYDDVGVPQTTCQDTLPLSADYCEGDDRVYDDVGCLCPDNELQDKECDLRRRQVTVLSTNSLNGPEDEFIYMGNEYSSLASKTDDDNVYDDVGIFICTRVNSIYASFNKSKQDSGKESEWEDVEESSSSQDTPKFPLTRGEMNKKKSGQRRTRKVRRQKSKASRRNSTRSSNLVTRQSCSFSDTASDDSNYETLSSFEPIGPSVDVDTWSQNSSSVDYERRNGAECPEAPSRPIPPPPRESSLTETFGKRMKMLKRTWSITKGSLGRMRRRASTSIDADCNVVDDGGTQKSPCLDSRKSSSQVFNFKRHFQNSKTTTSLSTFYLENESGIACSRNNNQSLDDIYGNSNWFVHNNHPKQPDNTDEYNVLSEEPLYQFYAAATVRGAFQSDSDSYEDSEDRKNFPSTSELGRPGHRTLWSQTPQVISSGLLERLTADEKKLQEAKFEILTSEASYLNSLRVLVNEYVINYELVHEALSVSEREKLFGNVPSVLIASERLLAELESTWRADPMLRGLPNVLLSHAERCSKVYVDYCSNQVSIDLTLKELKSKKSTKFMETVARIEAHPACQSLSLHSFLMLPMQRVTRLPLLADAVLSKLSTDHEERLDWEKVLSVLGKVVKDCNEGARHAGRQIEMETMARKLEYPSKFPQLDLRNRYLVRSGSVTHMLAKPGSEYVLTFRKKYHKTPLYLLLLNDHLLVAKLKTNGQEETYSVIDSCKRNLVALEKIPENSPFAGRHAMILSLLENHLKKHVEYILSCQNDTERERWLEAVSPPKPNVVGETLYESWDCPQVMALYSYTPCQPDELSLQPGDVINVTRKMPDGWNVGEKLVGGEQGWFPGNFTKEVASEHVRARNLRQRHRLLALSESLVQQRAKLVSSTNR